MKIASFFLCFSLIIAQFSYASQENRRDHSCSLLKCLGVAVIAAVSFIGGSAWQGNQNYDNSLSQGKIVGNEMKQDYLRGFQLAVKNCKGRCDIPEINMHAYGYRTGQAICDNCRK